MLEIKFKSRNFVDLKADTFADYYQTVITYLPVLIGQSQLSQRTIWREL
jgi:hypothetical protein